MDKDFIKQCKITIIDNKQRILNLSRMIKSNASKIAFYEKKLKDTYNQDFIEMYECLHFELSTRQSNIKLEKLELERQNKRLNEYIKEENKK